MRAILAARDVVCPVCDAAPGQQCVFVKHPDPAYHGAPMISSHARRGWDAQDAQIAMVALLNED